jgi:hypothetical protein
MPPWVDNIFFDLCARDLLRGGTLYRDVFLHGPPGMVLVQTAVRALLGWRSEIMNLADFAVMATVMLLLTRTVQAGTWSMPVRAGTALILLLFYFSTTEWCHAQPDLWMMLPAVGALSLRQVRLEGELAPKGAIPAMSFAGAAEGALWACAFLIKPFVVFPAVACWSVSVALARGSRRALAADAASAIAGFGLIIGFAMIWLWRSGNWPYFAEAALSGWNREYYQSSVGWSWRLSHLLEWFWPWSLVHLAAVPLALLAISHGRVHHAVGRANALALLGAFYLGWLVQALCLQRQFPYQLAPTVLLGLSVLLSALSGQLPGSDDLADRSSAPWPATLRWFAELGVAGFIVWAALMHPLWDRLEFWGRCWTDAGSPALWNDLALEADEAAPDWVALERTASFLSSKGLRDREVTCYSVSTVALYKQLDLRPSTRSPEVRTRAP